MIPTRLELFRAKSATLLILGCGCSAAPKTCNPSDQADPRAATLAPPELAVSARPPKKGEPLTLEVGARMICAQRFEAKRACAGNFGWRARDRATKNDEVDGYSDVPLELDLPYDSLIGSYGTILGAANDYAALWFVDAVDKSPQTIPWIGPSATFENNGPSSCGIQGKRVRCYSLPECGTERGQPLKEGRKKLEFTFSSPITALASNEKACVSLEDGTVHCWGEHFTQGSDAPECIYDRTVQVEGLTDAVSVAPGPSDSVCALRAGGSVVCWGRNDSEQFGVPASTLPFTETPKPVPGLEHSVRLVGADNGIAALQADGSIYYWGHPIVPARLEKKGPQKAELPLPAVDLLIMSYGVCALLTDRSVRCVGGRFDRRRKEGGPGGVTPFEGLDPWVNARAYEIVEDFPLLPPELRKAE